MAAITGHPDGAATPSTVIPFLLRLYPAAWRARYGDEFLDLLEARPPSLRDRFDVVVGAVDARVNPQLEGTADSQVRVPGDRSIRGLIGVTGLLLTVWGLIGISIMRPWNSGGWPYEPTLSSISYVAGMIGAFVGLVALSLIAIRYEGAIGRTGVAGALLAGSGLFLAALGAGALSLALLGVGTALLAWRLRGPMLDTPTALIFATATAVLISGYLAFAAGGGQDVRLLWGLIGYGPAWILFGLRLRAPKEPTLVVA